MVVVYYCYVYSCPHVWQFILAENCTVPDAVLRADVHCCIVDLHSTAAVRLTLSTV
jgi:hypothetical protein